MALKTIDVIEGKILDSDYQFTYQSELTEKLDKTTDPFTDETILEIVLWKVNRYPKIDKKLLNMINKIETDKEELDEKLTRNILEKVLDKDWKGFDLPMISAVLRFRNPKVYQIIDQRAYRFVTGKILILPKNPEKKIELYFEYLKILREKCIQYNIPFESADRLFYVADKRLNKMYSLKNF